MLLRIARASVWARDGVSAEDWRFRGIFRFVLPLTDVFFLWFGAAGFVNGVQSVQNVTDADWQLWWSALLAVSALVALVGVSFPRLWWVEAAGKIPLIAAVLVYVVITFWRGLVDPNVAPLAGLILILILLPVWRVGDLGFAAWKRKQL